MKDGGSMSGMNLDYLYEAMSSNDPVAVGKAIAEIGSNIDQLELKQVPEVVEVLASLFYIDLGDKPQFVKVVEDSVATIAAIGESAVPTLLWLMNESDLKANLMIGRTLGRIGPPAYGDLKDLFYHGNTPWQRVLALFALAKMHEAALMEIFPDVVNALDDSDRELRDTAARTVGRIISAFKPGQLPRDSVSAAFDKLMFRLQDLSAVVRSKTVRSIGKLAFKDYLDDDQLRQAKDAVENLLGLNGDEPDPFYLVRKEAEEALVKINEKLGNS
ncbi:MAG: hypothetical protein ABIC40_07530 [bacterium]